MTPFLEDLAARQRFGMRPGLDVIRELCAALGDPQNRFRSIHVAGTNGKGATCAMLDAALRADPSIGSRLIGRYTSPHLVRINERFFLDGTAVDDATLERISKTVSESCLRLPLSSPPTFFEALTAVAFKLYAEAGVHTAILECGLGGRLDATNICHPELCVITRIGLDHCDWLGDTVEKIAAEKAGILKSGVPVVLGANDPSVRAVVAARADEIGAPFYYAPELASDGEIPLDFPLCGTFNRENAVTALAALKVLGEIRYGDPLHFIHASSFSRVVWPGRLQRMGAYVVDGAHNPPAARALVAALVDLYRGKSEQLPRFNLVFGACGDKNVEEVLRILKPIVGKAFAVRTKNPRSLSSEDLSRKMRAVGLDALPCASLSEALEHTAPQTTQAPEAPQTLVCGSLFLAGEALVSLGACPWPTDRFDPSEKLKT